MKSFVHLLGSSLLCLLVLPSGTRAQGVGSSGGIAGTVIDASGAVLPKVSVVVADAAKGLRRTVQTDDTGQYRVVGLSPATYDVSAELAGFRTEVRKDVEIAIGATVTLDFQLNVASLPSRVEVTAEAPLVDTQQTHQANTVEERYIKDLPINRRDYLTYTLLVPGVSDSTRLASDQDFRVKQTPQSGLSFYGSNGRGNSVTVDGGEANDDAGGVRLNLSQDAVQEFQINRSNYSAELGGASGASINIVSKSGSNQVHGSLYGFFRDDSLDARNPFSLSQALSPGQPFNASGPDAFGTPVKDSLTRQQFGGTVGFPIRKDKTFMFIAFEGLRQDAQNAVPILTNTNIFRPESDQANNQAAVLAGLAAGGATPVPCLTGQPALPAALCAGILQSVLTVQSTPGTTLKNFIISQFEGNGGLFAYNTREYLVSGRLDHQFNGRNQAFLRYSYGHDREENPDVQSLTGFSRGSSIHSYDSTLQGAWFHQFGANTSNEARVQWNYNTFNVIPNAPGEVGLDIPGFANLGTQIFLPSLSIIRRYEFADNFTVIRGHHSMRLGGSELYRGNHTESHTFFPGRFVFGNLPGGILSPCLQFPKLCGLPASINPATLNSVQSVALGLPQFYQQGFDNPVYRSNRPFTALYWQDSWAIWPNFTLNYGMRYELDSQYGNLNTGKDNFAPRISFAWDVFKNHKTVVRGGYGIFYSPIYAQIPNVVQTLGIVNGFRQIAQVFVPLTGAPGNPSLTSAKIFQTLFAQGKIACTTPSAGNAACITPADLTQFGIAITHTGPIPPLSVIFSGQPSYHSPYSQQAEFGIEREISNGLSVSANYIYGHTLRLPVAIDINNLPAPFLPAGPAGIPIRQWGGTNCPGGSGGAGITCFVNPFILQSDQYSSLASAVYHGGILEIRKRFSNHFSLIGNYTYSKAIDETTDFNSDFGPADQTNLRGERGLSTFDQRHKIVFAAVLESPWQGGSGASLGERVLSSFQLSPILRYNSPHPFNLLAGTNVNNDRHSTNDRPPGAGRNTGIGPNYFDFDLRVARQIKLGEQTSLQLIAEGFNLFNRTNFGSVNNVVGVIAPPFNLRGTSGLSPSQALGFTSAFAKRQLQLGVRFSF